MRYFFYKPVLIILLLNINIQAVRIVNCCDAGRLGDQLFNYIKTKYISNKFNVPVILREFKYSNQLNLHYVEKDHYDEKRNIGVNLNKLSDLNNENITYLISYYFQPIELFEGCYGDIFSWHSMLNDVGFMAGIKELISPRNAYTKIQIPEGHISVAIHIRRPNNGDYGFFDMQKRGQEATYHPQKFMATEYYVEQIKKISDLFDNRPIYLFLFTDIDSPLFLLEQLRKAVNKSNIIFDCRKLNNSHEKLIIEDLFAAKDFDCLIRSMSNYSQIMQLIGNFKVVIYPDWKDNSSYVPKILINEN